LIDRIVLAKEGSMTRARVFVVGILLLTVPVLALAQTPAERPKPGPEHQKLDYFVGRWIGEGEAKASPFGPGGKIRTTDECKWFEGHYALVCTSDGKGPEGVIKSIGIISYSPEEKVYTYYGVDNTGMASLTVSRGAFDGSAWVFTDEAKMGGKMVKFRATMDHASPTSYAFKFEVMGDDGKWTTVVEGKDTKTK
jgi:hypothetical protein